MSNAPVAGPHPVGRVFGTDWSMVNVATLLRAHAGRGMWRRPGTKGGYTARLNESYLRSVSVRHLPTNVSLIFMQLEEDNCWYASLCFAAGDEYLPWNAEIAEAWLRALFGADRPRVLGEECGNDSVRQFRLKPA